MLRSGVSGERHAPPPPQAGRQLPCDVCESIHADNSTQSRRGFNRSSSVLLEDACAVRARRGRRAPALTYPFITVYDGSFTQPRLAAIPLQGLWAGA
jgi:hypothetical protein